MPTAGSIIAFFTRTRCLAPNQLIEVAALPLGRLVLHQQCEPALLEFFEPVIPLDQFQ